MTASARALRNHKPGVKKKVLHRISCGARMKLQRFCEREQSIGVRNEYTDFSPLTAADKKESAMIERSITLPEIGLIAGTRGMLGIGIGLLLSGKLNHDQRQAVGWTLVAVGALTTIPLAMKVFGQNEKPRVSLRAA